MVSTTSFITPIDLNPFYHCPDYRGPKDDKYVICLANISGNPCDLIKELHRAKEFRGFLAFMPFILSIFAIVLNSLFIYLIYLHVMRKGRSSKKRYTFLINRAVAAVIAQILLYVVLITWKLHQFKYSSATIFLLVGGLSFFIYTLTYIIMTFLLYKAVTQPFWYKKNVTIQNCLISILAIWIMSIACSIVLGLYGATLFYPNTSPIPCPYYQCQWPLSIAIVVILTISYSVVIAFYIGMVLRIRWKEDNMLIGDTDSVGKTRERSLTTTRNIRTMNRLSLSLIAFSVSKIPLVVVAFVALTNLYSLTELGIGLKNPCKTFVYSRLFYKVEILASIAAILWLLGMTIDPIISICSDPPLIGDLRKRLKRASRFVLQRCNPKQSQKASLVRAQTETEETQETSSGEF